MRKRCVTSRLSSGLCPNPNCFKSVVLLQMTTTHIPHESTFVSISGSRRSALHFLSTAHLDNVKPDLWMVWQIWQGDQAQCVLPQPREPQVHGYGSQGFRH